MSETDSLPMPLTLVASGHWTTVAGREWSNPSGGLWGGCVYDVDAILKKMAF